VTTLISRPIRAAASGSPDRFAGLGALVGKDALEWRRGRRAWVILVISVVWMTLTAAAGWFNTRVREMISGELPADVPVHLDPMNNLIPAVSGQIFLLAAIFAVASLLARERETGTLAWVASKPISRGSMWLSKWISSTLILAVVAVLVPIAASVALVVVLYGPVDPGIVIVLTAGALMAVAFYTALGLAAATALPGQTGVIAVGLAVLVLVPALAGLVPFAIAPYLPMSILQWAIGLASGADVGWVTPVAWLVATVALVIVGMRRLERIEL
jgi:ABC-2 type transport system permease protein